MKRTYLAFIFVTMVIVQTVSAQAGSPFKFQYAAKFVCGRNTQDRVRVSPGLYTTAVNILNPNPHTIRFRKRIALTYPPKEQRPGRLSEPIYHYIPPYRALAVDCEEIPREFFGGAAIAPYTKGFLIVESTHSLDVTAVYTSGDLQSVVQNIDVEQINERKVSQSGFGLQPLEIPGDEAQKDGGEPEGEEEEDKEQGQQP